MDGIAASLSLLALWLCIGMVIFYIRSQRRKRILREQEIERLMAQWIAQERRAGTAAEAILEQMPLKREEFGRMFDS